MFPSCCQLDTLRVTSGRTCEWPGSHGLGCVRGGSRVDSYDEDLNASIDAWVEAELAASPEWGPEKIASIRQYLEGSAPAVAAEE